MPMNATAIQIRRVTPAEAASYRRIRLEGLQRSSEAFSSTFDRENAQADGWFAERLASSDVLGAWQDTDLAGVAGFRAHEGLKEAHKGTLWGMYVRPEFRGTGTAQRLVEAVIAIARARVEVLQLQVWQDNTAARRLYESFGFVEYGLEIKALKQDGIYYNEILMAKALT
jgi:ribosomal protein S18 acetylase RimI-like enzyme